MAFTTDQLSQCKYHLGYGNLTALARPYFDVAAVFEVTLQNNCDSWGQGQVVNTILPNLNQLETDMMNCRVRFAADAVDETKRNPKELTDLQNLYEVWLRRLEKVTRIPRVRDTQGGSIEVT